MKKVLIVDDSFTAREYLKYIIDSAPGLCVAGQAKNGKEAVDLVQTFHPDVVSMDIEMPEMDGYKACRIIMETNPVPIVMVTSMADPEEVATSFKALEAGALAIIEKPKGPGNKDAGSMVEKLTRTLRLMASIKVVRRSPRESFLKGHEVFRQTGNDQLKAGISGKTDSEKNTDSVYKKRNDIIENRAPILKNKNIKLVVIGASTGGPPVIRRCLSGLKKTFPVPILVVQHITNGFLPGMVDWLNHTTELICKIAEQNEKVKQGHVYFAPDVYHMEINSKMEIVLCNNLSSNGICPSVSRLFASASKFFGKNTAGILLSGMGKDGAEELLSIKEKGGITIAQNKKTCIVFGMPGYAVDIDAADLVLPPDEILNCLNSI